MMIKIALLGMLAACAMAQFPMMGFAGLDLKNIKGMIPEGAFDMIKNMKPEDIKEAIQNMPPEMADMMKGMGISEDQIKEAINNMPEDIDVAALVDNAKDKMGSIFDGAKDEFRNQISEEMNGMKEETKKDLEEMGIDVSGDASSIMGQILPKFTEMMGEQLKAEGFDVDDHEKLREEVREKIREFAGADDDDSDEEVRDKLMKNFLIEMKDEGFDVDTENIGEGFQELKKQVIAQLKEMGFEIDEGDDIRDILKKMMGNGNFNPQEILGMMGPMMQGPPMMGPPPMMHGPPMGPGMARVDLDINIRDRQVPGFPIVAPGYIRGVEDSLMRVFGNDDDVIRHVMAVKFGAESGIVMEEDLNEILKDLMYYRLQARVLTAKNHMLRDRLFDRMY